MKDSPKKKNSKPVKEKEDSLESKPRISGLSDKAFSVIKFILGVCLLPFVYSASRAFLSEFSRIDAALQNYFWGGIFAFLIIYLFIWEPAVVYAKGQKILELIFTFFKPLVKVAPYLLPVYFLILSAIYGICSLVSDASGIINAFMLLSGFSIALHLVFGAKSLRTKQADFLKANYLFGFSFVYILSLALLSLLFSSIFAKFSFINFCNLAYQSAGAIFSAVFRQLFVNK
jgi:hypothetical protein